MIAPADANNQFYDDLPAPAAMHQTTYERQTAANRPQPSPDAIHAAPLVAWCKAYGVPLSTLYQLTRERRGPRTFKVGRRIFARRADWHKWLDDLATHEVCEKS
jgi:hypothetical protein